MKKLLFILSIFIVASCKGNEERSIDSLAVNQTKNQKVKLKRYDVESGIVKYKISINGKVMGTTITGSGTENLFFKNWGAIELVEENSSQTTKMNLFGKAKTETTKTHTMSKLDNGISSHVDFEHKVIYQRRDPAMDLMMQTNTDVGKAGKNMLEAFGGKKIGNEVFKGYNCEVWDISGAKQWLYKGVVLKLKITVMGITTIKEAISANFKTVIANHQLELPSFTIKKEVGFLNNEEFKTQMDETNLQLDKLSKMSFSEWKKRALADKEDEELQNMSEQELRQTYDMMQKMIKARKN